MTDRDEGLTPEQEAEVRRLLADARHTEPTPDAVVARLDRVLADLAGEPAREATVVRLADRRRRAATMLVAAAASVAAVVGIGQVLSSTGGDETAASSAEAGSGDVPAADSEAGGAPRGSEVPSTEGGAAFDADRVQPYALRSEDFADDADALQRQARDGRLEDSVTGAPELAGGDLTRVRGRTVCEPGAWGSGRYLAVLYDDAEGWAVVRRPRGDTQVVDLFLCGSESVVRSVTLPYP